MFALNLSLLEPRRKTPVIKITNKSQKTKVIRHVVK